MAVSVRFVGSGDSFGSGGRFQTCIVVDGPHSRFALDFGTSSLIALAQQGIEHNSLDAILLTHLHGDHCGGVPFLLIDAMLAAKRTRPLTIAGPRDLRRRMDAIREALFPGSHVMTPTFPLTWLEMEPGRPHAILDLVVTPQPARHTQETNPTALRVEVGGKVVAYTGDTEWTEDVARVARGADLFIAECYYYDKPIKWHLNYPTVAAQRDVADLIRYNLTKEGYDVVVAPTGSDALKQAREVHPDLVLLDIMVPQLNGWEVCRRLKQDADTKNIPVIMVTGRVEEGDKVLGFEMGADDYVTKPFSSRELLARIRAVARRGRPADGEKKPHVQIGDLEIDRYRFEVRMKGRPVDLTPKEFELLAILAGAPGRVFGREELLDAVWGRDGFVEPRTVDVHVARLRAKFTAAKLPAPGVETVRGVGYRFRDPSAA